LYRLWEISFPRVSGLICFSHVLPSESQAKYENQIKGYIGTLHPEVGFGFGLKGIERTEMRVRRRIVI
jgi:hypothetical protein